MEQTAYRSENMQKDWEDLFSIEFTAPEERVNPIDAGRDDKPQEESRLCYEGEMDV